MGLSVEDEKVDNVTVTTDMEEALALLNAGKRVILCSDSSTVAEVTLRASVSDRLLELQNVPDNMRQNRAPSPGTMGLMIDNSHPASRTYPPTATPTGNGFQWCINSYPLIIDRLPKDVDPVVEVIDNVERNYRLAPHARMQRWERETYDYQHRHRKRPPNIRKAHGCFQSVKEYMGSKNVSQRSL